MDVETREAFDRLNANIATVNDGVVHLTTLIKGEGTGGRTGLIAAVADHDMRIKSVEEKHDETRRLVWMGVGMALLLAILIPIVAARLVGG